MNLVIKPKSIFQQAERRRARRHVLCLDAEAVVGGAILPAELHELSRSGFLMKCNGLLAAGEPFEIRLAGNGAYRARAIWTCESLVGCEFQRNLSPSACSAALLQARPNKPAQTQMWWIDDDTTEADIATETTVQQGNDRIVRLTVGLSIALWATLAVGAAYLLI